jgi:hypothetical protein
MNPHTPKWAFTLGVGILMNFQIFKRQSQGSKFIRLKSSLYYLQDPEMQMSKMCSHVSFECLKHKL